MIEENFFDELAEEHEYSKEFNEALARYFIEDICLGKRELVDSYFGYFQTVKQND